MPRILTLLKRHGVLKLSKLLYQRIVGAEIRILKCEVERLNSRSLRVHPYLQETFSILPLPDIKACTIPVRLNGPLKGKFDQYGSDKEYRHSYREIYDGILGEFPSPRILEIGLGSINAFPYAGLPPGGSTKAFRKAYPTSFIVGCDIDPQSVKAIDEIGFTVDQTSNDSLNNLVASLNALGKFNLIIDDGFHDIHANVRTLLKLFPLLSSGGFYVIEDVHKSMIPTWKLIQSYLPAQLEICDLSDDRPEEEDNILLVLRGQ